ncbi:MAG: hypothetical protein WBA97_17185 [Actinophytocola sp.]|uniref:hypothetical protein n=1 Tax=Actinophytocola sp. TaxID=1872138 RepID=UPI003C75E02C
MLVTGGVGLVGVMTLADPSPAVRALMQRMRDRSWTIHRWASGVGQVPEIVSAVWMWEDGAADVVVIRSHLMASAYRAMPCVDCWEPAAVTLWDMAAPEKILREVLGWEPYGEEGRRREAVRPLPGLVLPLAARQRLTQYIDLPHLPEPIVVPPIPVF